MFHQTCLAKEHETTMWSMGSQRKHRPFADARQQTMIGGQEERERRRWAADGGVIELYLPASERGAAALFAFYQDLPNELHPIE